MDLKQELATVLSTFASGDMPREKTVEALLMDPVSRQQLLAHPRLAAILTRQATLRSGLTCSEVEDSLAMYIDAERRDDVRAEYEQLSLHLHLCPECYEVYQATTDILAAQATGALPRWPQAPAAPVRPTATIVLPRTLIRGKLDAWRRQRPARSRGSPESHQILYSGQVPGQPDLFARVTLSPAGETTGGLWAIKVELSGTAVIASRLISLDSGAETRSLPTDAQGGALFTSLPATWIAAPGAPDLRISVDEPTPRS